MARKTYSEEFRRDAVDLYVCTEGATVKQIAADLGITDATLSSCLKAAGVAVRGRTLKGPVGPVVRRHRPRNWLGSGPGSTSWRPVSGCCRLQRPPRQELLRGDA